MKTKSILLTKGERGILILATRPDGQQLSNSEISQRLGISVSRVKNITHQTCVKLGAHNRAEVIFFAIRRGEIRLNDFYSLDALAEVLGSLGPGMLRRIAHLVRQELELGYPPREGRTNYPCGQKTRCYINEQVTRCAHSCWTGTHKQSNSR